MRASTATSASTVARSSTTDLSSTLPMSLASAIPGSITGRANLGERRRWCGKTLTDLFTSKPDGEPGNDDLGATSSWVVFAQLGMFPEIPGVAGLSLNSPVFPEVTLKLGDHSVQILSPGAPGKLYVQRVSVDAQPISNSWIEWDKLRAAKTVDFTLSETPVKGAGQAPPSFAP